MGGPSAGHTVVVPELLEVEVYRRAAERVVGRTIESVVAPDAWFLKRGLTPAVVTVALEGATIEGVRRRGKLLLLDTDGPVLGLRFGMTGRLIVDGLAAVDQLEYSSIRDEPAWDRFALGFAGGGSLRLNDPRRLGGVELDPDEDALGRDALAITPGQLAAALAGSRLALKARLLDQTREWRAWATSSPTRCSGGPGWIRRARRAASTATRCGASTGRLRRTLGQLGERGGSHLGDLQQARQRGGICPRDGTPLERRTIGGRTTYSCPTHQR